MSHDAWGGGSDDDPKLRDKERARRREVHRAQMAGVERLLRDVPESRNLTERLAALIPALATMCGILALILFYIG